MEPASGRGTKPRGEIAIARTTGARIFRTWPLSVALLFPSLVLIGCFFLYPLLITLYTSVTVPGERFFTIQNYADILQSAEYWNIIWITVLLGIATTACSIAIAIPLALQLRKRPPGHELVRTLILIPLVVLVLIGGLGLLIVLSDTGWVGKSIAVIVGHSVRINYTIAGLVIAYTWLYAPYTILTTLTAIESINPEIEEAARVVGARPSQVLLKITLPLSLLGIKSGAILTFLLAFEAFGVPLIAGGNYRPLAVAIYTQAHVFNNHERGSALAIIMAGSALALLALPEIAGRLRPGSRDRTSRRSRAGAGLARP
jgi:putative spermidine/putrescine transport system permease protein